MISKIKIFLLSISTLFIFAVPVIAPAVALAEGPIERGLCYGADNLKVSVNPNGSCPDGTAPTKKVNDLITEIINVLSVVIGIIAVIMIIIGGFHYITSGGSDEKVKKAKNTILYAIIGLVVVALAQIIVKFVLNKVTA